MSGRLAAISPPGRSHSTLHGASARTALFILLVGDAVSAAAIDSYQNIPLVSWLKTLRLA